MPRRTARLLAGAWLVAGLGAVPLAAQDIPVDPVITLGGLTTDVSGTPTAYVFFEAWPSKIKTIGSKEVSLWMKAGSSDSANPYARIAVLRPQTSPQVIETLVNRAVHALGEEPGLAGRTIDALFQDLLPTADLSLGQKVSALVRAAMEDEEAADLLLVAVSTLPSLNMAFGNAFAVPLPAGGVATFELRMADFPGMEARSVVGRVTLDHANPTLLPPPTTLAIAPPFTQEPGYDDLNIRFRWDTPPDLLRLGLLMRGFNLYRVPRSVAESFGWDAVPPLPEELAAAMFDPNLGIGRVNRGPLYPAEVLSPAEVVAPEPEPYFARDHESQMPGYPDSHTPVENGLQFYYFVSPRDALGRDHAFSHGVLGTFCTRMPPPTPDGLVVENYYHFDGATPKQVLKLTWDANPPGEYSGTSGYLVYRWENSADVYSLGANPLANLIAGPIPHVPGQTTYTYLDDGPGSPSVPADLDQTYWYTLRAVDDSSFVENGEVFCPFPPFTGNLSGHSPPVFGVLRDREGPEKPGGAVRILCGEPEMSRGGNIEVIRDDDGPERGTVAFEMLTHRLHADPNIAWVEFEFYRNPEETILLLATGPYHFLGNEDKLLLEFFIARELLDPLVFVRARAGTQTGEVSEWYHTSTQVALSGAERYRFQFIAQMRYTRHPLDPTGRGRPCRTHYPPPPGSTPPNGPGIWIDVTPTTGTAQYKIYYTIDDGPMLLLKEGPMPIPPVLMNPLPAAAARVCFYARVFDVHGNPSALAFFGCVDAPGSQPIPKPMLAPILGGGSAQNPVALIQWFCPPHGISHFEVTIANTTGSHPSPGFSTELYSPVGPIPIIVLHSPILNSNVNTTVFETEKVGPLFGNGATFTIETPIDPPNANWLVRVRAVAKSGLKGPFSNEERFTWSPPPDPEDPDVPWPARPLPSVTPAAMVFNGMVQAVWNSNHQRVGVRVGRYPGRATSYTVGREPVPGIATNVDPFEYIFKGLIGGVERRLFPMVLYRIQVPDEAMPPGKPFAFFETVPGDVVQVSPMMDQIASAFETGAAPAGHIVYDPFMFLVPSTGAVGSFVDMYVIDSLPVLTGARYRYLIALYDETTRELVTIIPTNEVDIPLN